MLRTVPRNTYKSATYREIKRDILDFLQGQDEFKDFDFEGSKINKLVDLLVYNTLYMQQFANASIYESTLETAAKRSSVVLHAQDKGYLPSSKRAAQNVVQCVFEHNLSPSSITIPKNTKFLGTVLGTDSYDFVTWDDYSIIRNNDDQYIANIRVIQGRIVRRQFDYQRGDRLIIEDPDIDRNFMRVSIDGSQWINWTRRSMVNVTGASNVYYVRETIDGYTEIFFGEGEANSNTQEGNLSIDFVGGLKPSSGSNIVIEYIKTKGEAANGSVNMSFVDSLTNIQAISVTENFDATPNYTGAAGGGDPEEIETIRMGGRVKRESQNRAVTFPDYEAFVREEFGNISQSVKVFGEEEKPGYAFISIKPIDGLNLTTTQKEDIENYIEDYNIGGVTPKVVDPNYMYIDHDITVSYKIGDLSDSEEFLRGEILTSLADYYLVNVENFDGSFHASKASAAIDDSDESILGTELQIRLVREIDNFYRTPMSGIKYLNPLEVGTVRSDGFEFNVNSSGHMVQYISTDSKDVDSIGKLLIGPFESGEVTSIDPYTGSDFKASEYEDSVRNLYYEVGTINYVTNIVEFDLGILAQPSSSFRGSFIKLSAIPLNKSVYSSKNSLIVFEPELRPEYFNINLRPVT